MNISHAPKPPDSAYSSRSVDPPIPKKHKAKQSVSELETPEGGASLPAKRLRLLRVNAWKLSRTERPNHSNLNVHAWFSVDSAKAMVADSRRLTEAWQVIHSMLGDRISQEIGRRYLSQMIP